MAKKDTDRRKKPQSGKERREDTRYSETKGRRSGSSAGKPAKRGAPSSTSSDGRSFSSAGRSSSSTGRPASQSGRPAPSAGRSGPFQSSQYRGRKDYPSSNNSDTKNSRNSSASYHDNVFQPESGGTTRRHNETVIGFHAIEETLKSGGIDGILYVSGKGNRHEKITALAKSKNIRISKISDEALQSKYPDADVRGIVLEVTAKKEAGKETTLKSFLEKSDAAEDGISLIMILDSITDPHNLGAILRSADQFGVDLVILPSRRSAGDNATVRKISSGASEYVPIAVENLSRAVDLLKKNGYWVYAADMGGDDCWKLNLKGKTALILGSEGEGVSRILSEKCDSIIKIPASGHVDSFNVSVAAGILMYEAVRQQAV